MSEKKSHGVQLLIRAVVRDPDGRVIHDTGRKPSKSFVIQFLEYFWALFRGPNTTQETATDGTEDYYYYSTTAQPYYRVNAQIQIGAPVNQYRFGQVVGTGDTAEDNEDYKLDTQLTEGIGVGNITHGEQVIGTVAVVGANVDLEIKRVFTNNTGSTITIKEAGLYVKKPYLVDLFFCIIRDVLVASVDVPDKCSLTMYYTLRTTV